jgi:hypothetical protein
MTCSIAIYSHKTIILSISYFDHTVEVSSLEEGVKFQIRRSLPMLPAERSIGELHIVRSLDVVVGKGEGLVIP